MYTLLESIYNLLSYATEDRRQELSDTLAKPMNDLMSALETYMGGEGGIIIRKDKCGDFSLERNPFMSKVHVRDYDEDMIDTLRENVKSGAEVEEALAGIKSDEHGFEYLEYVLD